MKAESQIPMASRQFAVRVAIFYGTLFGVLGTHLPFFTVWLRSIGIDAAWIGIIAAVPAVTRFTILPFLTAVAERRHALRGALVLTALVSALGFALVGSQRTPVLVFLAYVVTCAAWTPMLPLADAYALRGVVRYGLNYGRLRLSGSAAFVVGAVACGLLADVISPERLIWVIVALAALCTGASLALRPMDKPASGSLGVQGSGALLRDRGFLSIIVAAALIQGSHAAYYTFASITWQSQGLDGLTIAGLWVLGVLAEIVIFALSPRLTLQPATMMVIGAAAAVMRWIVTAAEPQLAVLAVVQLTHGLTFGLTQVGTMGLLVRHVPTHVMARGQGYFAACSGIVASSASILSGLVYARYGQGVYDMMAMMAGSGGVLIWLARHRLLHAAQPHNPGSGG
jgi:PPP family 3-phenylpropionic acid transporter